VLLGGLALLAPQAPAVAGCMLAAPVTIVPSFALPGASILLSGT